jgi:exosome complex component RRP4
VASHGHNGALQLQTRSSNYGRLDSGVFVRVYAALVKRSQQHFVSFDFGVQVILANNGFIWIKKLSEEDQKKQKHLPFMSKTQVGRKEESVSGKDRENICRVRNAILALQAMFIPIHQKTILDVLESSKEMEAKAMTIPDQIPIITASAQLRVQKQMLEEEMDTTSLY